MPSETRFPIHELLAERTSPYGFDARPVSREDLGSLFEAARWAPSSFNEQPWSFVLATKDEAAGFERLLGCLVPPNRVWAAHAPVLVITVAHLRFARNDKPNRHAFHDVGLAAALLTVQAQALGLRVHQMAGIDPDHAREVLELPEGTEAVTGIAIGYPGAPDELPSEILERDRAPRSRKPLDQIVHAGRLGQAYPF